jgi:pimeloyl-ACP methyl ester carboxylesterase
MRVGLKYGVVIGIGLSVNLILFTTAGFSQNIAVYKAVIEPCECQFKIDSSFQTRCGYLVVPENRKKRNNKTVKLPFIQVMSKNPNKRKDPLLFTGGGPGASSLGWARAAPIRSITETRDCIAFEQRGTRFAIPELSSEELSNAIKDSYRKNLNKDSMVIEGTKRYKKSLEAKGIDLSGYNTDETVSDIHDLLTALKIDSVNLLGISYSGGLMMAVLQRDPSRIRSLILDSPLPTFVPIDEDEPANFAEALAAIFRNCEKDSADKVLYGNLKKRFEEYFNSIESKFFYISYVEKGKTENLNIQYSRNELLQVVIDNIYSQSGIKDVPFIITELIKGNHQSYIKQILDNIFGGMPGPSGMRISVYCADQTAYHSENILKESYNAYPWLKGYRINDVFREICDCWKLPPIAMHTKQPFYSLKPALLADGEMDPACRPLYNDRIHHYMPNSQRLLYLNRAHGVLGGREADALIRQFLDEPFKKIESGNKDIIAY